MCSERVKTEIAKARKRKVRRREKQIPRSAPFEDQGKRDDKFFWWEKWRGISGEGDGKNPPSKNESGARAHNRCYKDAI
jgi:hypothetical protein